MIGAAVAALAFCALPGSAAPAAEPSRLAGAASGEATLEAVDLAGLPGFPGPDPAVALDAFRRTCAAPPVAMAPAVTGS
ncbi:MAG: hypothetical protein Q7T93_03170, partial [Methylobacterium sp.]|nr:hypothetical protein [Methylobacterium sp.]